MNTLYVIEHDDHHRENYQSNLGFDDNMSVLNLNPNSETMGLETVDFSSVDFGKFEDIGLFPLSLKFIYLNINAF